MFLKRGWEILTQRIYNTGHSVPFSHHFINILRCLNPESGVVAKIKKKLNKKQLNVANVRRRSALGLRPRVSASCVRATEGCRRKWLICRDTLCVSHDRQAEEAWRDKSHVSGQDVKYIERGQETREKNTRSSCHVLNFGISVLCLLKPLYLAFS